MLTVFDPQSPQAREIVHLAAVCGIILAAIFIIVSGMIVYALMRCRWREGEADPKQVAGNKTVELVWTAIPCLIVVTLFVLTWRTMAASDPPPAPEPDIVITGHQWWWEVRYPKSGVVTANEIHIPAGKALSVRLEAADVLHEFWVAELTRKMTNVPGHPNHVWLQADRPGTYLGVCSEFCGTQHAWMRFTVVAESPAEFGAWESAQLAPARIPAGGSSAAGLALFLRMTCVNCHAIGGTSASGVAAPDLTHFASRRMFGAGIAQNGRDNLRRWLADPHQIKPGVRMPDYKFNDEQLTHLVDYLETLQ